MTSASPRVLIADDDRELCQMLEEYLGDAGIAAVSVHDGQKALDSVDGDGYRLLILDVMLPGLNGFDVLRKLRARTSLPVLMLTAKGDDTDRIVGLELGADDYLPKPFNPRELLARVRAVLRRSDATQSGHATIFELAALKLDAGRQRAWLDDDELELTSAEFRLLELLMRDPGELVSRDRLSEYGLGRAYQPPDRSIDTHVSNLRRKLGAGVEIRGVRNRGYLLLAGDAA